MAKTAKVRYYICIRSEEREPNFECWSGSFDTWKEMISSSDFKTLRKQFEEGDIIDSLFYLRIGPDPGYMPVVEEFPNNLKEPKW